MFDILNPLKVQRVDRLQRPVDIVVRRCNLYAEGLWSDSGVVVKVGFLEAMNSRIRNWHTFLIFLNKIEPNNFEFTFLINNLILIHFFHFLRLKPGANSFGSCCVMETKTIARDLNFLQKTTKSKYGKFFDANLKFCAHVA